MLNSQYYTFYVAEFVRHTVVIGFVIGYNDTIRIVSTDNLLKYSHYITVLFWVYLVE